MSEPVKTKAFLLVECEVVGKPNFFDLSDGTLKEVAKEVLFAAMENHSDYAGREGVKFKCLAGTVTMQIPKIVEENEG